MREMNKNTSYKIIIIMLILITYGIQYWISASAEEGGSIEVLCPESINIGASFDVRLCSKSDSSVKAIMMNIDYSDCLSYKNVTEIQRCEIDTYNENNHLCIIILFDEKMTDGDICSLTFTAKTGMETGIQNIKFEITEAVDSKLNDISVNISKSADIRTIKKGDTYSSTSNTASIKNVSENKNSVSRSKSSSLSFSSAGSSRKTKTSSSIRSGTVSRLTSSKKNSKITEKRKTTPESGDLIYWGEENVVLGKDTNEKSSHYFYDEEFDNLNMQNDKNKYFFAGVGITLASVGLLFASYRLGQLSRRKNDIEKVFKDDDKPKE